MKKAAILCVDDEKIVLDSLKSQLMEGLGSQFLLEFVEDAYEGLEVIDELVVDGIDVVVIISDWMMPGMNGDEFFIAIHQKYPDIVKIMLTGQASLQAIKNATDNANLYKCLEKPWNKDVLINTILTGLKEAHVLA